MTWTSTYLHHLRLIIQAAVRRAHQPSRSKETSQPRAQQERLAGKYHARKIPPLRELYCHLYAGSTNLHVRHRHFAGVGDKKHRIRFLLYGEQDADLRRE